MAVADGGTLLHHPLPDDGVLLLALVERRRHESGDEHHEPVERVLVGDHDVSFAASLSFVEDAAVGQIDREPSGSPVPSECLHQNGIINMKRRSEHCFPPILPHDCGHSTLPYLSRPCQSRWHNSKKPFDSGKLFTFFSFTPPKPRLLKLRAILAKIWLSESEVLC